MKTNTARKMDITMETKAQSAEIFDFNALTSIQVATEAEKASHLPKNTEACDYEEFLAQYGMNSSFA